MQHLVGLLDYLLRLRHLLLLVMHLLLNVLLRSYLLNTEPLRLLRGRLLRDRWRLMHQLRCNLNALLNRMTLRLDMLVDYLMLRLLRRLPMDYLMSLRMLQNHLCRRLMGQNVLLRL